MVNARRWSLRYRLGATALASAAMAGCLGLHPQWWWMWLAPVPLLVLAARSGWRAAALWATLAALIGGASWLPYLSGLLGPFLATAAWVVTALRWGVVVGLWRWMVGARLGRGAPWVYATLWVATETVAAAVSGNGSWGSLALTQMDDLPVLQVASVFGSAGVVFVVSLGAATLACAWCREGSVATWTRAVAWPALFVACVAIAGAWRLAMPATAASVRVGLAAIDAPSDASAADRPAVWQGYLAQIASLAASGAQVVVLPEKIETLVAPQAVDRAAALSAVAHRANVTVVAGVALEAPGGLRNRAWRFVADGSDDHYDKRRLVPGWEDRFVAGSGVMVGPVSGQPMGLAVCRDLDDTSVARDYAHAGAAALLVPAWDFDRDAWMHARIAVLRGVEHGYSVVRSARNGVLTVSDRLGRVVAEQPSRAWPGAELVADLPLAPGGTTPYARWHDAPAWLCVAGAIVMAARTTLRSRRAHSPTSSTASTTL